MDEDLLQDLDQSESKFSNLLSFNEAIYDNNIPIAHAKELYGISDEDFKLPEYQNVVALRKKQGKEFY